MWDKLQQPKVVRAVAWTVIAATAIYWIAGADYAATAPLNFKGYLKAFERIIARQDPYAVHAVSPFKYSPGILAAFGLLPLSSPLQAWWAFRTLSVLVFSGALALGARYATWKEVGLLVTGLLFSWKGIGETLAHGQMELLIFGIAIFSGVALGVIPLLAGLLAGTLPWIKIPWVALGIPLLLAANPRGLAAGERGNRRERRIRGLISGYLLAALLWGAAVPSITFGSDRSLDLSQRWVKLLAQLQDSLFLSSENQSFWALVERALSRVDITGWFYVLGVGGVLAGLLLGRMLSRIQGRGAGGTGTFTWISPWLVITQILNPMSWQWGSVFLVGMPFAIHDSRRSVISRTWTVVVWVAVIGLYVIQIQAPEAIRSLLQESGIVTAYWLGFLLLAL